MPPNNVRKLLGEGGGLREEEGGVGVGRERWYGGRVERGRGGGGVVGEREVVRGKGWISEGKIRLQS